MLAEIFSRVGLRRGALFPTSICEADFAFDASQHERLRYQLYRDTPAPGRCAQASLAAMPSGYSRNYYDLHQLAESPIAQNALLDLNLLEDVIQFKSRFYHSSWAHYEQARPGTFRLLPTPQGDKELQADYQYMESMFFSKPPTWKQIIDSLRALEQRINRV
ncbi:nucleotidyl transferase AbiEii/AbiGii toxin family protein [Pirellulaceae bacterium SH467]